MRFHAEILRVEIREIPSAKSAAMPEKQCKSANFGGAGFWWISI
jgi:hypothetical protein